MANNIMAAAMGIPHGIAASLLLLAAAQAAPETPPPGLPEAIRENPVSLSAAWEVPFADSAIPWLTAAGPLAVAASRGGHLTACDPNGVVVWTAALDGPLASRPVEAAGRLAALGEDGMLRLLDAASGTETARAGPFSSGSHLSEVGGALAVADPAGQVTLVEPATGSRLWEAKLAGAPSVAVARCSGLLLAGSAQGSVTALDPATGAVVWTKEFGEAITTPAGCWRRLAYVGSADNRLHAFKVGRRRANHVWSYTTGGDIVGRPFTYGSRVLFFSYDTYLYALQADNGHLSWKARLGRRPASQSVLMGRLLVVAPLNTERLETFLMPEGTQGAAWILPPGQGRFVAAPASAGGRIVAAAAAYGDESARLIGFDPAGR